MLIVPIKWLRLVPPGISSRQGCRAQRKSPSPLVEPSEMVALSALELVLSVPAISRRTGPPPQSSSNTGPELRKLHRSTAIPRPGAGHSERRWQSSMPQAISGPPRARVRDVQRETRILSDWSRPWSREKSWSTLRGAFWLVINTGRRIPSRFPPGLSTRAEG